MKGCSQGAPNLKSNSFSLAIIHLSDDSLLQATVGKLDVSLCQPIISISFMSMMISASRLSHAHSLISDTSDASSLEKSLMKNKKESFPFIGVVL